MRTSDCQAPSVSTRPAQDNMQELTAHSHRVLCIKLGRGLPPKLLKQESPQFAAWRAAVSVYMGLWGHM